jgi:CRP/FNR family cyclic AMP-dependent transcriptional regulator
VSDHANGIWYLRNLHLFKGLTARELNELEPLLDRRDYRRSDVIFQMGERGDSLYFLGRGTVAISVTSAAGEERILEVFKPGDTFGDLFLGQDRRRLGTARALSDVEVWTMREEAFTNFTRARPDLCLNFIRQLVDRQRRSLARMEALMHIASGPRLLAILLDLGERCAPLVDGRYTLPGKLTQESLALMTGLHRSTVSKLVNDYRRKRILGGQRAKLVLNVGRTRVALRKAGLVLA